MRSVGVVSVIAVLFLQSVPLMAQGQKIPAVQFHGSDALFGQYANRQGTNSQVPASQWYNDLKMTLTIYGIPISTGLYITSEQNRLRQSIDNFSVFIDVKAIARRKKAIGGTDSTEVRSAEKGAGIRSFLSKFTTLEAGTCRPSYGNLTLKGIPVTGVNIEFTPGKFYAAFTAGKVKRAVKQSDADRSTYKRTLIAGRIGVGRPKMTHLYLTLMKAGDKVHSLSSSAQADTLNVRPQSTLVLGSEAMLLLFKKKLIIEGEVAASLHTRDTRCPELFTGNSDVPAWLINLTKPGISSSLDYAYNVKSTLNLKTTKISAGIKMIGAGFTTLGNPNLIRDRLTWDGRIDQAFAKKKISFSAYLRQSHDNLINWKNSTTTTVAYGVSAGFRFKKMPYILLSYTPNFQKNNNKETKLENSAGIFSAVAGYDYPIGDLRSSSSFNFFYQNTETVMDTVTNLTETQTYTLNEVLTFKIPFSIHTAVSVSRYIFSDNRWDIMTLNLGGTYNAFKNKWINTIGGYYTRQAGVQKKTGLFYSSKVKLWRDAALDLRAEENIFRDKKQHNNDYNEFILSATLSYRW